MTNKMDIFQLYTLIATQISKRGDEYISPLSAEHRRGIFGLFANIYTGFEITRPRQYFEIVTYAQKQDCYFYKYSNANSFPAPGREKHIQLITHDPNLILKHLTQYKVA